MQKEERVFKISGIVEAFFGRLWSMDDRKSLVARFVPKGLNHYLYAAKEDPKQRKEWREPYTEEELGQFRDFIKFCSDKGVAFNYGISPQADLSHYDDERGFSSDVGQLANKLATFAELGCRNVTLFLEDLSAARQMARTKTPPQKGQQQLTVGLMHAKLANDLAKRVADVLKERLGDKPAPRVNWYMCPTHSCGDFQALERGTEDKADQKKIKYWRDLNQALPTNWTLLFTGRTTVSANVTVEFAKSLSAFWKKRKLILLDNFPLNDYRPHILFLHAYQGREAGIENYFEGVLANPMDRVEASTIPLTTVFDFLRDPAKYNHNTSLFGALNEVFENNSLNNLMVNLIQYYPSSPLCNKEKIIELHKQRKVQKTEQQHLTHLNQGLDRVARFLQQSTDERRQRLFVELEPFFTLARAFVVMNLTQYALEELLNSHTATESAIETTQLELTEAQRTLDALLFPSRPAKLLRQRLLELNERFCS